MSKTIIVLGDETDEHAAAIYFLLRDKGHQAYYFDTADYPQRVSLSFNPLTLSGMLNLPEVSLQWSEIDAVYWRCFNGFSSSDLENDDQNYIAKNDSRSLLEAFFKLCPCKWVNGYEGYLLHQQKPYAFHLVNKLNLKHIKQPRTLIVNEPADLLEFVDDKQYIFKPVQGGAHTEVLTAEMLEPECLENLKYAPITVQEKVSGGDIRVFVIGDKVFSIKIISQELDFRDDQNVICEATNLPVEVQRECQQIASVLKLAWTGIDLRLSVDGHYYYFEANPSPMFMGFEEMSTLPLTESFIEFLTN